MLQHLNAENSRVLRLVLGAFRSTSVSSQCTEASIPALSSRRDKFTLSCHLRLLQQPFSVSPPLDQSVNSPFPCWVSTMHSFLYFHTPGIYTLHCLKFPSSLLPESKVCDTILSNPIACSFPQELRSLYIDFLKFHSSRTLIYTDDSQSSLGKGNTGVFNDETH